MRHISTAMILVALLVAFLGLVVRSGEVVIAGAFGLAIAALIRGNDRSVPAILTIVVSATVGWAGPPLDDTPFDHKLPVIPRFFVRNPVSPESAVHQARVFLETSVSEYDRPFIFFQFWGMLPDEYRSKITLYRLFLQTVNNQSPLLQSLPVPGTDNALWFYDIRLAGQTTAARSAVARRDVMFREPFISHVEAEGLRRLACVRADVQTFHCEVIVPGPWFLRQIMQVENQSPAYYDLLYSQERYGPEYFPTVHKGGKATGGLVTLPPEPQQPKFHHPGGLYNGVNLTEGWYYVPNSKEDEEWKVAHAAWQRVKDDVDAGRTPLPPGQVLLEAKLLKDFPATAAEFDERWGDKAVREFLKKQQLKTENGEVVAGILDDPRFGSIVSYHNRAIYFGESAYSLGVNMRTADFFKSSGKSNLANQPKQVAFDELEEDASERLNSMPNGFPASYLAGKSPKRERIDFGDGRVVRSSLDPHHGIIFTQYSCFVCHAPGDGVLSPTNRQIAGVVEKGRGPLRKNDPFSAAVMQSFYTDWDWKIQGWRLPYARVISRMTATKDEPKGWDGSRFAREITDFVGWYDAPVSLEQAAAELGIPVLGVMIVCLGEGSFHAQELFMGNAIPREVFDDDLYLRLAQGYTIMRDFANPDPMLRYFLPELIRQTDEKVRNKR